VARSFDSPMAMRFHALRLHARLQEPGARTSRHRQAFAKSDLAAVTRAVEGLE